MRRGGSGRPFAARLSGATCIGLSVLALIAAGCGETRPEEKAKEARVVAKLSFDETVYVDAAIWPRKLHERLRRQTQSIFPALQKADVTVTARKQGTVDLASIEKEPVRVVDPTTGITRAALRVRYHFVAAALVPRAMATRGFVKLGVLHDVERSHVETVLSECTANGERERADVAEPWRVFDASLPGCAAAIAREEAAITAARKALEHPDTEIVPGEFERAYEPAYVRLERVLSKADAGPDTQKPQQPEEQAGALPVPPPAGPAPVGVAPVPDAPAAPSPVGVAPVGVAPVAAPPEPGAPAPGGPGARASVAIGGPVAAAPASPAAAPGEPTMVYIPHPMAVAKGEDFEDDLQQDESELFEMDHSAAVVAGYAPAESGDGTVFVEGGGNYLKPNFVILYVAVAAIAVLLVGKNRQTR